MSSPIPSHGIRPSIPIDHAASSLGGWYSGVQYLKPKEDRVKECTNRDYSSLPAIMPLVDFNTIICNKPTGDREKYYTDGKIDLNKMNITLLSGGAQKILNENDSDEDLYVCN